MAALCSIALPCALGAQRAGRVELGSAVLRQGGIPQSSVVTLASELTWSGARASAAASGITARTPDDRWTGQALLGGSLYAGTAAARWELGGSVGAFGESNALPSTSLQLALRRHLRLGAAGELFAGLGGAATVRAASWRGAGLAHAGVALPFARGYVTAALAYTDARRELRVDVPPFGPYTEITPARFGDALAFWQRVAPTLELSLGGGARFTGGARVPTPWASASAALWVTPRLAVVAALGRALEDVVRAVPETRYASLALRVPLAARASRGAASAEPVDDRPRLYVERAAADTAGADSRRRVIGVRLRRANTVELMGDFTDWAPVSLTARDGAWSAECTVTPGAHRVAVRVDGGAWQVPANLPPVADDFGGTVGLLTVP